MLICLTAGVELPDTNSQKIKITFIIIIAPAFKAAAKQSACVLFDIRRMSKIPEENIIKKIEKEFAVSRAVKRILIITKDAGLIDIVK